MPRIPAAIAVVMLVATCIGFNTARFPVVLEMAAVPEASSSTRVVVCAESAGDSTDSDKATGRYGADTDEAAEESSSGYRSSWSSYGNDDSEGESEYSSYSYGSQRSYGEEEEEEPDESNEEESSSKYSSSYGSSYASNRYSSGKSHEEEGSSGEDASDSQGDSYGYGTEDSSGNEGSSSSKFGYGGYGSEDSSDEGDYAGAKRNRRNKSRAKSDACGSGESSGKSQATPARDDTEKKSEYSWNDSSQDESNGSSEYDSYGSGKSDSNPRESYSQSDSYDRQDSAEDWENKSSGSYDDNSSDDPYGTNSYANDTYSRDDSSYGDSADSYGNTYENTYGNDGSRDNSVSDSNGNDSSFDDDRSPTRYGERQEAAADYSSTWSGGDSATASPSGPYAYGPPTYEDSAAASAGAAPASSNLGLVPVEEERQSTESWGNTQSDYDYGRSPVSTGYSGQNRRSMASSTPPGFTPLPPVDRSVRVPGFSPLTGGSIPIYPSTGAM